MGVSQKQRHIIEGLLFWINSKRAAIISGSKGQGFKEPSEILKI